jgi:hypothetical protein
MWLEKIKTIYYLIQRLKSNPTLRYNCGFAVLIPALSEATFCTFLDKIASSLELARTIAVNTTKSISTAALYKFIDFFNYP